MSRRAIGLILALVVCLSAWSAPQQPAPSEYDVEFKKGYDALVDGKYPAGMASMKRCLELRPNTPVCAYNLACAHARQGETDLAVGWFEKCVDWGFGYDLFQDTIAITDKDADLDSLRQDPRFIALNEKLRAHKKRVEDYVATPASYVPARLADAAEVPLLVVLHDSGSTKDAVIAGAWKELADELGCALLAPSARLLIATEPARGMRWFANSADYLDPQRTYVYDKTINAAVDQFKKLRKLDRARIFIAGEGDGAVVALRMGLSYPSTYKGVWGHDVLVYPQVAKMVQDKGPGASKSGLKLRLTVDAESLSKRVAADPKAQVDVASVLANWRKLFADAGYPDALATIAQEARGADGLRALRLEALKALAPTPVEAGAPKK